MHGTTCIYMALGNIYSNYVTTEFKLSELLEVRREVNCVRHGLRSKHDRLL